MAKKILRVDPIAGALGAEISGVDLSEDLDDDIIAEICRAWLDHLVIFFRGQELRPARLLAFARRFGEVVEYPFLKGLDEFPEITPVVKLEHERANFGGLWHSDTLQGHDGSGKHAFAAASVHPSAAPGIYLPLPLGEGFARFLGQLLRPAQPDQRLSRLSPDHAPRDLRRRPAALISRAPRRQGFHRDGFSLPIGPILTAAPQKLIIGS
jgi:hypothetical protein